MTLKKSTNKKNTHGGARPGSGWRDREKRFFRYQTRLRRDQIEKLKQEKNAAAVVRAALDNYYQYNGE